MRGLFIVIAVALAVGTVRAQPATTGAAADAALTEGRRFYDVREWDKAIAKFKEAYTLRPDPASLFNLAQSYRLKGDCINAAGFYKTFKRNYPGEKNIDKVDKFIVEMDTCAKTQAALVEPAPAPAPEPTPDVVEPKPVPVVVTPPPVEPAPIVAVANDRSWMKWTGIAMIGVGVVGVGVGTKFALDSGQLADDLQEVCAVSCTSQQANAIEDDGNSANTKAYILTSVGGAFVLGGAAFLLVSRGGEHTPQVTLAPTRGGATATYVFTF